MAIPTVDINESSPAGSDNINAGDNKIREHKTQVRQIMEVDHEYPSTGSSETAGQHKQVTLQAQSDLGTGASDAAILGLQGTAGSAALVFTSEDDTDVPIITSGNKLDTTSLTTVASISTIMNLIYPVGSQYVNYTVSTNPATLLGMGTWVAVTEKVTVGIGGSGIFSTLTTGGAKSVTLTEPNIPEITPTVNSGQTAYGLQKNGTGQLEGSYADSYTIQAADSIGNASPTAVDIVQEFRTAYVWERTA